MKNKYIVTIVILTINLTQNCYAQNWTWNPPLLWTVTDQVGIGTSLPAFKLDVTENINLEPNMMVYPETGYRWNSEVVLKTSNTTENIFLGNNAGDFAGSGTANTFLGAYSGELHSGNGGGNTFVGWNA